MNDNKIESYKKTLEKQKKEVNRLEKLIKANGPTPISEAVLSSLYDDIIKFEKLIEIEENKKRLI